MFERRSIEAIIEELGPIPRPEHPRPDAYRSKWANLNGVWEFAFDPRDEGLSASWQNGQTLRSRVVVPFCPESQLSGIFDEGFHKLCWYARGFDLPESLQGSRILLHFGAVDYRTDVWLNGNRIGQHTGGYDSFAFDITSAMKPTGNRLVLRVEDDPQEPKPRGKQSQDRYPSGCQYMRITGIWQTVWLEGVGGSYLSDWIIRGDLSGEVHIKANADGVARDLNLTAAAYLCGAEVASKSQHVTDNGCDVSLAIPNPQPWSPDSPTLYDLDLTLTDADGTEVDRVRTYFGLREIAIRDGMVHLNGAPFFVISALDQGYYPQGLYTPPSDEDLREDVEWAKRYGLNNVRKHQIVAEPRFHYWCDRLGLTIWAEMADVGSELDDELLRQWSLCMKRDMNHPCIITWVPSNEQRSPDDPAVQRAKVRLYEATKALDPELPAIDTSGYCHTVTDITDLHVNPVDGRDCVRWWRDWRESIARTGNFPAYPDRPAFCPGYRHQGQPVMYSETGNWWITALPPFDKWKPYGYGPVATVDDFVALYLDFFLTLMAEPECAGFSYVQLYDVEGEVNGYLTYDRKPKVAPEVIAAIHEEGLRRRAAAQSP